MSLPYGTEFKHYAVGYDPVYAHDYYLRNRKLKGRRGAQAPPPPKRPPQASTSPNQKMTVSVKMPNGKTLTLNHQQIAEAQAHAAARVSQLKQALGKLESQLRQEMAKHNSQPKGKHAPTAADKAKAVKDAKQYRQKHKQSLATKRKAAAPKASANSKPKADSVATLQNKISQLKGALNAAEALQRSLASATKNG